MNYIFKSKNNKNNKKARDDINIRIHHNSYFIYLFSQAANNVRTHALNNRIAPVYAWT